MSGGTFPTAGGWRPTDPCKNWLVRGSKIRKKRQHHLLLLKHQTPGGGWEKETVSQGGADAGLGGGIWTNGASQNVTQTKGECEVLGGTGVW